MTWRCSREVRIQKHQRHDELYLRQGAVDVAAFGLRSLLILLLLQTAEVFRWQAPSSVPRHAPPSMVHAPRYLMALELFPPGLSSAVAPPGSGPTRLPVNWPTGQVPVDGSCKMSPDCRIFKFPVCGCQLILRVSECGSCYAVYLSNSISITNLRVSCVSRLVSQFCRPIRWTALLCQPIQRKCITNSRIGRVSYTNSTLGTIPVMGQNARKYLRKSRKPSRAPPLISTPRP